MRKFRASLEPFWDLKISKYVEYLTRVSSKYLTSSVLPSLTSSDSRTSHILLADVIPWIYIDSPALIYSTHHCHKGLARARLQQCDQPELRKEYCVVEFVSVIEASKLSASRLRVDLRRHLHDFWGQHRSMCTHSIDDLLPHAPLYCAATGEMVKGS